jgi:hypothetical protein
MKKITLGFITGCLNKQKSILPENLYHRQILNINKKESDSFDFEIALGSYVSYSQFRSKVLNFIKDKNPDFAFIFLRPFPLMPLNKPIFKYKKNNEKTGWAIHPSLFNHKNFQWDEKFSKYEKEIGINNKQRKIIEFRDFNLLLGLLLGLNKWCIKFLLRNIKTIDKEVNSFNTKLFFVSLPKNPESLMGNYICKKTNRSLQQQLTENFKFIDIYHISEDFFEKDGIHFNSKGHEFIAQILLSVIKTEINYEINSLIMA